MIQRPLITITVRIVCRVRWVRSVVEACTIKWRKGSIILWHQVLTLTVIMKTSQSKILLSVLKMQPSNRKTKSLKCLSQTAHSWALRTRTIFSSNNSNNWSNLNSKMPCNNCSKCNKCSIKALRTFLPRVKELSKVALLYKIQCNLCIKRACLSQVSKKTTRTWLCLGWWPRKRISLNLSKSWVKMLESQRSSNPNSGP